MQSKKQRNREIERRNKNKRHMFMGVTAAVLLVIVLALAWTFWDVQNRRWVMTFNGERIPTGELLFFDLNFMGHDMGTPEGFDVITGQMLEFLTILDHANRHGITLTEVEQLEALLSAQAFGASAQFTAVPDERMAEFFSVHQVLRGRLADIYVSDMAIDPDELAEFIAMTLEIEGDFIAETEVRQLILSNPDEDLERVLAAIGTPEFDALVEEFAFQFEEEWLESSDKMNALDLADLLMSHFRLDIDDAFALIALQEGEYGVYELAEATVVVYMHSRTVDYELLEDAFLQSRRNEVFQEILDGWVDAANVNFNNRVISRP